MRALTLSPFLLAIALLLAAPPAALADPSAPSSAPLASLGTDDDEETDEPAEPVEIPPPPRDNLSLPSDLDPKVREEFDEALELYEKSQKRWRDEGLRKDAIRAMKGLTRKVPSGQAHYYLAILYQWERDYKKARQVLEEVLGDHPEFYEAHVELGDVEVHERKLGDAIPHYERALAIYPYFEYGVDRMMQVLVQLGRFEEANPWIERALLRGEAPVRVQCREAVKLALKGPDWDRVFTHESDNYIVKTEVSQEFAVEIADTAELIRELYDVLFPEIEKPDRKYVVIVHRDRGSYLAAGAPPTSAGYYSPLTKSLHLYREEKVEQTFITLKHEGFHQYCNEYADAIPQWFNEGLADYFSTTELVEKGKKRMMRIRPNNKRMEYLVEAWRRGIDMPSLPELMNMSREEMYDIENGGRMGYLHYCQAWAACFFAIEAGNEGHRSAMKNYFKAIRQGKNAHEAYRATFGRMNMKKFEEEWKRFIQDTIQKDPGI